MENQEISHIKKILGLQHGKEYDSTKSLRYGHLMIMADQDHDGSHIKGLIINFLDHFFPSLLRIPGFLLEFITPIVKVRWGGPASIGRAVDLGSDRISHACVRCRLARRTRASRRCRSSPSPSTRTGARATTAARAGRSSTTRCGEQFLRPSMVVHGQSDLKIGRKLPDACHRRQGLGTSTASEAKDYFSHLKEHRKPFAVCTEPERELIDMAFNKKKADERKEWLRQIQVGEAGWVAKPCVNVRSPPWAMGPWDMAWQPGTFIDHSVAEIRVEDFINRELILFSMADNVRYGCLREQDGSALSGRKGGREAAARGGKGRQKAWFGMEFASSQAPSPTLIMRPPTRPHTHPPPHPRTCPIIRPRQLTAPFSGHAPQLDPVHRRWLEAWTAQDCVQLLQAQPQDADQGGAARRLRRGALRLPPRRAVAEPDHHRHGAKLHRLQQHQRPRPHRPVWHASAGTATCATYSSDVGCVPAGPDDLRFLRLLLPCSTHCSAHFSVCACF